eukprot:COSAG02_NODE_2283_length_9230_cov_25.269193_4_plen_127_part_00
MICLGWCSTANPSGNVTAGGARVETSSSGEFGKQTFCSDAEAQLTAQTPREGIDRGQEFVAEDVDHWGHRVSEGLPGGPARDQFWMTSLGEPRNVPAALAAVAPWVAAALDGRPSLRQHNGQRAAM